MIFYIENIKEGGIPYMMKYELMHKDVVCGLLTYDEDSGRVIDYKDYKTGYSPFLGNSDSRKIKKWWEMRSIPASRNDIKTILKESGCLTPGIYLAKNLALSMTDCYWIRPEGLTVNYDDVNLLNLAGFHDGKIPYHNATSYSPNASLGGQMDKYWDMTGNVPVLVKESYKYYGQQAINEVFATYIHQQQNTQIPYVIYSAERKEDGGVISMCNAFTSNKIELVSAYEIIESEKTRNEVSLYDNYINICEKNGIDKSVIQDFMDYQTLTDFIITNTDEHLLNFGVLRDSETMKLIGPAPIYDSGNSMFYSDNTRSPYSRSDILDIKITAMYKKQEGLLKKIRNKNIVKVELLPTAETVKDLYCKSGIPEWKADVISKNYETKLEMTKEFQRGETISVYFEKEKEKKKEIELKNIKKTPVKFLMLCGVPGAGKTKKANELKHAFLKENYHEVDPQKLYPLEKALNFVDMGLVFNKNAILSKIEPIKINGNAFTVISSNEIREKLNLMPSDNTNKLVFAIVDARMISAFQNGINVIYDATNLDKNNRLHYINLAKEMGISDRELFLVNNYKENENIDIPGTVLMNMEKNISGNNAPDKSEGWTKVHIVGKELERTNDIEEER